MTINEARNAVGSGFGWSEMEPEYNGDPGSCINCKIRPHSDYDLFYCDKCRPR